YLGGAAAAVQRAIDRNPRDTRLKGQLAAVEQARAMKAGLEALYQRNDPGSAIAQFSKVLELNPDHFLATLQLASALDRAGRPGDARPYWERALTLAEAAQDEKTQAAVRARLRGPT